MMNHKAMEERVGDVLYALMIATMIGKPAEGALAAIDPNFSKSEVGQIVLGGIYRCYQIVDTGIDLVKTRDEAITEETAEKLDFYLTLLEGMKEALVSTGKTMRGDNPA